MYNIKGPSKIVAKTSRRGLPQNFEILHNRSNKTLDSNENIVINGPKPVFQNSTKVSNKNATESITPQHEELIKFIQDSWILVTSEMKSSTNESKKRNHTAIYYEDPPCPQLQDFKPFDLESWWGKRLYAIITSSVNS